MHRRKLRYGQWLLNVIIPSLLSFTGNGGSKSAQIDESHYKDPAVVHFYIDTEDP